MQGSIRPLFRNTESMRWMHLMTHAGQAACCALALWSALAAPSAIAAQALRVAVQENSAPKFLDKADATPRVEGICPDILAAIERRVPSLDVIYDPRPQPLKRLESNMESGLVDANCLIDTNERRAKFKILPTVLFAFDYHLIARSDDPARIANWQDVRDLGPNGRILVVTGSGSMGRLALIGGLHFEEGGKSVTANLQKLVLGRGRFFYYRIHEWERELNLAKVGGMVKILPAKMEIVHFRMMFGKHVSPDLIEKTRRALQDMDNDGELVRIRDKWNIRTTGEMLGVKSAPGT